MIDRPQTNLFLVPTSRKKVQCTVFVSKSIWGASTGQL